MANTFNTPTASYDAERNEFSFTFPTNDGMRSVKLIDGRLRQSKKFENVVRYSYAYNSDSDLTTREAFSEYIFGKTEEAQRDAAFLAEHAVRAFSSVVDLSSYKKIVGYRMSMTPLGFKVYDNLQEYGSYTLTFDDSPGDIENFGKTIIIDERHNRKSIVYGDFYEKIIKTYDTTPMVMFSPVPNPKECSHADCPLLCSEDGHEDAVLPLEEYIDQYAAQHPDGFTLVVPRSGELDKLITKMLETKPYKPKLLLHAPRRLRAAWMLYAIVQPDTEFSRHYAHDFEKAFKQLYDYFGVDPENDERGNAGFERSRILDDEMRHVVAVTMRNLKNHNLSDAYALDGQDVLMVQDTVTELSPIGSFEDLTDYYDPQSATLINLIYNK